MRHPIKWYKPGKIIHVSDKMQHGYSYTLEAPYGKKFHPDFKPELSPMQMLCLGVFEGKYLNDCVNEFPVEWYSKATALGKLSLSADPSKNLFKIKSRLSLQEWRKRKWIPITDNDHDVRGWFQWYCRYWIGRRDPNVDEIQIGRWRSFTRHAGQIVHSLKRMPASSRPKTKSELMKHRPRQRQALLQWAYKPMIKV